MSIRRVTHPLRPALPSHELDCTASKSRSTTHLKEIVDQAVEPTTAPIRFQEYIVHEVYDIEPGLIDPN